MIRQMEQLNIKLFVIDRKLNKIRLAEPLDVQKHVRNNHHQKPLVSDRNNPRKFSEWIEYYKNNWEGLTMAVTAAIAASSSSSSSSTSIKEVCDHLDKVVSNDELGKYQKLLRSEVKKDPTKCFDDLIYDELDRFHNNDDDTSSSLLKRVGQIQIPKYSVRHDMSKGNRRKFDNAKLQMEMAYFELVDLVDLFVKYTKRTE